MQAGGTGANTTKGGVPEYVAPIQGDASERSATLRRLGLLEGPSEEAFDRLTRLVSAVLKVPVSLVTLIDGDRQFFKSAVGLPEPIATTRETPLSHSICQHVVADRAPLVVEDARNDPRLRGNLAVEDLGVVAYAGVPLMSDEGVVIGSLCAIDVQPRTWSDAEVDTLRALASVARAELSLRSALEAAESARRVVERASAERTAVIESSTDGIYTVDMSGACTLVNTAATELLGFSREDILGRNMHQLVHHHRVDGTVFPESECPFFHAFRDGHSERVDDTVLWRADGTSFPAECTSSPLFVEGKLEGAVVTFRDVSERVAAAALVRESEMKFRAIFENAGLGIVITSDAGRLLDCNEAYERITGHTRAELLSTMFDMVTHPDDVEEQLQLGSELISGVRDRFQMDKRYIRKDREIVWGRLTATAVRSSPTAAPFIVGAVEDVTLQRRAEGGIRLLSEASAVLASSLEYEETLRDVARLALPLLGEACVIDVHRDDDSVDTITVHLNPDTEKSLAAALERVAPESAVTATIPIGGRRNEATTIERPHPDGAGSPSDGARLDLLLDHNLRSVVSVPLQGRENQLGRITFAAEHRSYTRDDARLVEAIAARISATVENALLFRRAQTATRARDEVLAVVTHDLRNPVHTITMSASFLLELEHVEQAAMKAQLGVIRRAADRANRLIRDLLDVTRIENGQLRLDRNNYHVAELLNEAAQLVAAAAEKQQITLRVAAPAESVLADLDRDRVLQALDNLLGNAIKFTPAGGLVVLSSRHDENGSEFEVKDSGPGVPVSDQPNLFRRFWQARRVDRRGVGLGLSIVKGIVDAHGGDIRVESDGKSGTTIRFRIPEPRRPVMVDTLHPEPVAQGNPGQVRAH